MRTHSIIPQKGLKPREQERETVQYARMVLFLFLVFLPGALPVSCGALLTQLQRNSVIRAGCFSHNREEGGSNGRGKRRRVEEIEISKVNSNGAGKWGGRGGG